MCVTLLLQMRVTYLFLITEISFSITVLLQAYILQNKLVRNKHGEMFPSLSVIFQSLPVVVVVVVMFVPF